jgi:hypothetical protein
LDDRQAHSHSDEHREKECDKLSCRPAFHDASMLALKQVLLIAWNTQTAGSAE